MSYVDRLTGRGTWVLRTPESTAPESWGWCPDCRQNIRAIYLRPFTQGRDVRQVCGCGDVPMTRHREGAVTIRPEERVAERENGHTTRAPAPCEICGTTFQTLKHHPGRFCTETCRKEGRRRDKRQQPKKRKPRVPAVCTVCGASFTHIPSRVQKTCGARACRTEQWRREHRRKLQAFKQERQCPECGVTFWIDKRSPRQVCRPCYDSSRYQRLRRQPRASAGSRAPSPNAPPVAA